jgi:GNAT superfamily N-acetyltransferase
MTTTTRDRDAAVRLLVAAFADDPVARWLLPGSAGAAADQIFGPTVERSAALGELAGSADGAAVAVWVPRASRPPELDLSRIPARRTRLRTFMTLTEQRHPTGRAHLHLVFLAVAPGARGRGLGAALLGERLAEADAAGVPAYLEASSPRNLPLYERHGFRTTGGPITLPDGPPLWPMWRDPRS